MLVWTRAGNRMSPVWWARYYLISRLAWPARYPLAAALIVWGWSAAASFIFLSMTGYGDDFDFPWVQWWIALPYMLHAHPFRSLESFHRLFCFIFGGIAPMLVVAAFGFYRWRAYRLYGRRLPLFGETRFAKPEELLERNVTRTRNLWGKK